MAAKREGAATHILGVTGPIGCGKSTVGDLLLDLGARECIDADDVVHILMMPGTSTTKRIESEFGSELLAPDGSMDRGKLGSLVFADPGALHRLEAIVHPAVREAIRDRLQELQDQTGVVIVDAVKLLQSDLLELCDAVWVVRCAPREQRRRLTETRGLTPEETTGRLAAQPSFEHAAVTSVVDNSGTLASLRAAVTAAWKAQTMAWGLPMEDRVT